jgi:outer membrane protein assembly factor BamB
MISSPKPFVQPIVTVCFLVILYSTATAGETDWRQFRGTAGDALASEALPTDLSNPSNYLWETKIDGIGWSSPVVDDDKIWLTSSITQKATAAEIQQKLRGVGFAQIKTAAGKVELRGICVDANTGTIIHEVFLANVDDPDPINPMNSYASPTAAISQGRVVLHFGNYGTWCLDTDSGEILWKTQFVIDHSVGPGSSPVIVDELVLLVCDGIDQQFVAAVHLSDGKTAWKTPRPPIRATNGEFQKAYSTPFLMPINGKTAAVIPGAQWTVAYEPQTGKEIWRADCGDGYSTTPMAVEAAGFVITSTGYTRPKLVALKPTGTGDISRSVAWEFTRGVPTMPSYLSAENRIYMVSDRGILSVLDATTGEALAQLRIGGNFSASPILANEILYLTSREGVATLVDVSGTDLKVVATHDFESPILATPAPLDGDLIVRTERSLVRISK